MDNLALPLESTSAPPSTAQLHHGDCLEVMPTLKTQSVAMCFADLPYGLMNAIWDTEICFKSFWSALARVKKDAAVSILTASHKFAHKVMESNLQEYRYDLIWHKTNAITGMFNANKMPLRAHENLYVFYKQTPTYNPQKTYGHKNYSQRRLTRTINSTLYGEKRQLPTINDGSRFPTSVLPIKNAEGRRLHPTQKPVALLEWLVATYTNPGDTVLDPVFGSNTTGIACARLGRNYIGIEKDAEYFRIGKERLDAERARLGLTDA